MDYNKSYYNIAVSVLQGMRYYYGDLIKDCTDYIKRYYPNAKDEEVEHAIRWALADTWNSGCEQEMP